MSCCRARLGFALRRVLVLKDPLAPDTGLRRRMIRRRADFVVDDRTDETSGRDEKDVGVHSCNCGVAEKSATRMAHAYRGKNSREDRNPILYGMARYRPALVQEWYYGLSQLSSNKVNGRVPHTHCPALARRYFSRKLQGKLQKKTTC